MGEKLRACDCGAVMDMRCVVIFEYETDGYLGWVEAWVQCKSCQCHGPECKGESTDAAIAAAIAGWNNRPVEDVLRARVNDLEDVLRSMLAQFEVYTSPFSKQFVNKSFTPDGQEVYILRTVQGKLREVIVRANNLLNAAPDGRHE